MSLGAFTPVPEWVQQLRIEACQASEILGVDLIRFAFVGEDVSQFAGIGHQDLVSTLPQEPVNPRRVGSRFYGDAHGLLGREASPEGFGSGAQSALLHNLAALLID
jgi:hypothetical protein